MYDYCASFLADYVTCYLECNFSKKEANKFRQNEANLFAVHAIIFNYQFFSESFKALIFKILKK